MKVKTSRRTRNSRRTPYGKKSSNTSPADVIPRGDVFDAVPLVAVDDAFEFPPELDALFAEIDASNADVFNLFPDFTNMEQEPIEMTATIPATESFDFTRFAAELFPDGLPDVGFLDTTEDIDFGSIATELFPDGLPVF